MTVQVCIINITDTNQIDNRLVLKNMEKTNNQKKTNNSTVNYIAGKPLPRYKAFGFDPATRFCKVEDDDKTK